MMLKVEPEVQLRAKRVFLESDPAAYFAVILQRYDHKRLSEFTARPTRFVFAGGPAYQFAMLGFVLTIGTAFPKPVAGGEGLLLGGAADWIVPFAPFWGSVHERAFREMVARNQDPD